MTLRAVPKTKSNVLQMKPSWRHFLALEPLTAAELSELLHLTKRLKNNAKVDVPKVRVANLFFEASTRTKTSFEIAERRLGLEATSFASQASSVSKGESLIDTVDNLAALGIMLVVVRHSSSGAPAHVAEHCDVQVINAGDGQHEHPTQGLLDLFTLWERWNDFKGKKVAILGDILHSRVARSNLMALPKLGAEVRLFGPPTLVPKALGGDRARVAGSMREALDDVDAVIVLRLQHERMSQGFLPELGDYTRGFGLTASRAAEWLKPSALILHPGPMNRGVEIDSEVADGNRSVILDQVANGVFARMAVLVKLLGVELS